MRILSAALVVTSLGENHPRLGALDLRRFVTIRARLLRRGSGPIEPLLLALEVVVVLGADVCQSGMSERKIRIECDRVLVHLKSKLQILPSDATRIISPSQIQIVGLQVLGRFCGESLLLLRRERDPQRSSDLLRDLILHFEDVFHLAVVSLRPERENLLRRRRAER